MKKIILMLFMALSLPTCLSVSAQQKYQISFVVKKVVQSGIWNKPMKSPKAPPTVYQEDNTLTFVADHPEYVLYIKDEDEEVVYSTVVTSAETEVTLPSYLSGTYEIELVMGNWLFTGWIDL